ncbi:MAG: hypothetical protein P4L33_10610 [Capsulimonadaceae bacterium]|nr:hypothetical protein [Capsulimonadaceae bacterium]
MAADYTNWPVVGDITAQLASVGVSLRLTNDAASARLQQISGDVTADVARRTCRQFVADPADTVRLFDGTGTAEIEIDEYVSFTSAQALGYQSYPGYPLANIVAVQEYGKPNTRLVRGQGSVPAYPTEAVLVPIPAIFPAGRQNIQVTATFGFAAAIPVDLWNAVCGEIARRAGNEALFNPDGGMVIEWQRGDGRERYAAGGLDALGWGAVYERKVKVDYKRPAGRRLRNLKPKMI